MKTHVSKVIEVLIADDDSDDRDLITDALKETEFNYSVRGVENGEDLLDYLRNEGKYEDKRKFPTPSLIFLDLNMPRKDGREALKELRADMRFRSIPIVVLTTSHAAQDVINTYYLGANSFITKPESYHKLKSMMAALGDYWFRHVELPPRNDKFQAARESA